MKLYHYFTLLVAVTISICAAYYSIVGLAAIFAAAAIPVIIMGAVLELAKITGAVWLKLYWNQATWWIKIYLIPAVAILMFITSLGIFGFLSKAHIEQTAGAQEGLAKLEQIETQIARKSQAVSAAEEEISKLENTGFNRDQEIQSQIDAEQRRIDSAYTRIQPAIDEQNSIIAKEEQRLGGGLVLYQDQLSAIDVNLQKIEEYIATNNVKPLQTLVGVRADGSLGPATTQAIDAYRTAQAAEKQRLSALIATESSKLSSPIIDAARAEIQRQRSLAEQEIASSNQLVSRLRLQLGTTDDQQLKIEITKQNTIIDNAEAEISALTEEKYKLETEARKLAAEVGPIKYVAELIYGNDAGEDLLEQSVQWMILLLVIVFDPLAVILTMAAITGISQTRSKETTSNETVEVEKIVEVEVEKIVEVPVEVIVERVVEVPVEDAEKAKELAQEVEKLLTTIETQSQEIKSLKSLAQAKSVQNQPPAEADFDLGDTSGASFGSTWPVNPTKGQLFLKIDTLPNKLYKWNNRKWIEIDRGHVDDTLAYNRDYIKWLVNEVKHGRREFDELSDVEQQQIKTYIVNHGNSQ
jgi:hypothetical protein